MDKVTVQVRARRGYHRWSPWYSIEVDPEDAASHVPVAMLEHAFTVTVDFGAYRQQWRNG